MTLKLSNLLYSGSEMMTTKKGGGRRDEVEPTPPLATFAHASFHTVWASHPSYTDRRVLHLLKNTVFYLFPKSAQKLHHNDTYQIYLPEYFPTLKIGVALTFGAHLRDSACSDGSPDSAAG